MTPEVLLNRVRSLGARLKVSGERLLIEALEPLPDHLLSDLRAHKPQLMAILTQQEAEQHLRERLTEAAGRWLDAGADQDKADLQAIGQCCTSDEDRAAAKRWFRSLHSNGQPIH